MKRIRAAKREVLDRIMNVIKLISKLGVPYRGKMKGTVYTLADLNAKNVQSLDLTLFLSQDDVTMRKHIQRSINKNYQQKRKVRKVVHLT